MESLGDASEVSRRRPGQGVLRGHTQKTRTLQVSDSIPKQDPIPNGVTMFEEYLEPLGIRLEPDEKLGGYGLYWKVPVLRIWDYPDSPTLETGEL